MTLTTEFNCQNNGSGKLYSNAVAADFYTYTAQLLKDGWERYYSSNEYGNLCAAYKKGNRSTYVYYMSGTGELRTVSDDYTEIPSYIAEATVCDTTLINVGFDFSDKAAGTSGSALSKTAIGQSQVLILEDGSYVIVDGGSSFDPAANSTPDALHGQVADSLYSLLQSENKSTDGKIVIAAWIFTHLHRDHCTTFERFSISYGDKVNLKHIIYNYPWTSQMYLQTSGKYTSENPHEILKLIADEYYGGAPSVFVPRTGQKIRLGSWEMEVLTTYENIYPSVLENGNDCSMVFRLRAYDHSDSRPSVLFLGDIYEATSAQLLAFYGENLRTLIVQAAHHGFKDGGSQALYNAIKAEHVIWTNSYASWCPAQGVNSSVVPDWITCATDNAVSAYPQCDENEKAVNHYLTFEDGKVTATQAAQ